MNIYQLAELYLQKNSERLDVAEKADFRKNLTKFLGGDFVLADEVYDFLVYEKLIKAQNRHEIFANYLAGKYSKESYKKILDVGAGRLCKLSAKLSSLGYEVYAQDPKIRLTEQEAKNLSIKKISRFKFACDDFSKNNAGTPVGAYDVLVGLEPCDATEHIIRQALKYDKPFDVHLCYAPHAALSGENFKTPEEWYKHLKSISDEIKILQQDSSFIATNNF